MEFKGLPNDVFIFIHLKISSKLLSLNKMSSKQFNCIVLGTFPGMFPPTCINLFPCSSYFSMCVCPPPRLLITSGVMWCHIDPIQLVE